MLEKRQQPLDAVVEFAIDDNLLVSRICGRWFHLASGRDISTNQSINNGFVRRTEFVEKNGNYDFKIVYSQEL